MNKIHLFDIIVAVKNNDFTRAEMLADICLFEEFLSLIEHDKFLQVKTMINNKLITTVYQFNKGISKACEYNRLEILKYLLLHDVNIAVNDNEALQMASKNGHNDIIKFILSLPKRSHIKRRSGLLSKQLSKKSLNVMTVEEIPETTVVEVNVWCLYNACKSGHLETVKLLLSYNNSIVNSDCIDAAIEHPEILKILLMHFTDIDDNTVIKAASLGQLESLKLLATVKNIEPIKHLCLKQSCMFNRIEVVKYLVAIHNVKADNDTINFIIEFGFNELIKLLDATHCVTHPKRKSSRGSKTS